MRLKKYIMTNNTCYKEQLEPFNRDGSLNIYYWEKHKNKKGIVVHSTGVNNKYLKRYIQPLTTDKNYNEIIDDIGRNTNGNDWNHAEVAKGVHAFIGLNANDEVETYNVLPYEWAAYGAGRGVNGSYNYAPTAHIQFEICEDSLTDINYFDAVMKESIEYCAYLCEMFGWNSDVVCSHAEAHKRGYAVGHKDIDHWLRKFGRTMDWFRSEVQKLIDEQIDAPEVVLYTIQAGDSLSRIAMRHGTTVDAICDLNNIINPNIIYIGDEIKIPLVEKDEEYTIEKSDNLSSICRKFGVTQDSLCRANGWIEEGKKIIIPRGGQK